MLMWVVLPGKKERKKKTGKIMPPCTLSNFRAQVVIDVANFAKTESGHETGPQGTDFSLDP